MKTKTMGLFTTALLLLFFFSCATASESGGDKEYLRVLQAGLTGDIASAVSSGAIDLNYTDEDGSTYLHLAAWHGDADAVKNLIIAGIDVNRKRLDGYTALHWAAYQGFPDIASILLRAGAEVDSEANGTTPLTWAAMKENNDTALILLKNGASLDGAAAHLPRPTNYYVDRYGPDFLEFFQTYGISAIASVFDNSDAFETGDVNDPPYPEAELSIDSVFNYLDDAEIEVSVSNTGEGNLYKVAAEVSLEQRGMSFSMYSKASYKTYDLFFGKVKPGQTVTRRFTYDDLDYYDCGIDIPINIVFSEANDYPPEPLAGKLSVAKPDNTFLIDRLPEMSSVDIRSSILKGYFSENDLNRAVFLRAADLTDEQLRKLITEKLIDRTAIDKIVRHEKYDYDMEDLIFFADTRSISQENLELVLLEKRIPYTTDDVISVAREYYISRQVVEALYAEGMKFSGEQIKTLIGLGAFSTPEILYTYTIDDYVGNKDGMIQIKEGVHFNFIVKNDSVFDINNINVALTSSENLIDVHKYTETIDEIKSGETVNITATISVKPAFRGDKFTLKILMEDNYFGNLVNKPIAIPVGRTVGSRILTINKKIASKANIIVRSGASDDSTQIAALAEGAVFDAIGELSDWYKVGIYGRYGWVKKNQVSDFTEKTDSTFLVENRSDFAVTDDSDNFSEQIFVNSRPTVTILSPQNNDDVYNRAELELLALDQSFGIGTVDIKVNGVQYEGSGTRGLRVSTPDLNTFRKAYPIILNKGENTITVTAYNNKNVGSDPVTIKVFSKGVQNPPSLYALAIGVSKYENTEQNLNFAASDAAKISEVLKAQIDSDIYEKVEVRTLLDDEATRGNMIEGINNFLSNARTDDVAILFFAGHGITDNNRYFLLGHDADIMNPQKNGYKKTELVEDLNSSIQARKLIVMLDSCQSGGREGIRGIDDISAVVESLSEATGSTIMSASRGNESAIEREDWGGGAFTSAIVDALENKNADENDDGFVDVNELDKHIYNYVIDITGGKQHPQTDRFSSESYKFFQIR